MVGMVKSSEFSATSSPINVAQMSLLENERHREFFSTWQGCYIMRCIHWKIQRAEIKNSGSRIKAQFGQSLDSPQLTMMLTGGCGLHVKV